MPFGSSGTEISLDVDGDSLSPGSRVLARVNVSGELDAKVRSSRVELLYTNEYRYQDTTSSDSGSTTSTRTDYEDVVVDTRPIVESTKQLIGDHDVELKLPPDVPPSAGELVEWKVRATIHRRLARDPETEAPITVLSPPELYAGRAQLAPRADPGCDMQLHLAERTVREGDRLIGTLVVIPRSEGKVTDIRVELHYERSDQDGLSDTETVREVELAGATQLVPGQPSEYPFELTVPAVEWPSFRAIKNEVHWRIEGIAARSMMRDFNVKAELNVYSAQARA